VLDVKTGSGAFMQTPEDSRKLARSLVAIGRRMNKRVTALITDMNQPLGRWVGNAVETLEAIECLQGKLDGDFAELCLELAAQMIVVGGIEPDLDKARQQSREAITSGQALEKFKAVIEAQGGDALVCDDPTLLPQAAKQVTVMAPRSGFVAGIKTDEIGRIVMDWGGGRRRLEDKIDYGVGLYIHAKLGAEVKAGEPLVTAYFNDESKLEEMQARLLAAYRIEGVAPPPQELIKATL
jgi:pyrimidine-nucleoside phosphorylase